MRAVGERIKHFCSITHQGEQHSHGSMGQRKTVSRAAPGGHFCLIFLPMGCLQICRNCGTSLPQSLGDALEKPICPQTQQVPSNPQHASAPYLEIWVCVCVCFLFVFPLNANQLLLWLSNHKEKEDFFNTFWFPIYLHFTILSITC